MGILSDMFEDLGKEYRKEKKKSKRKQKKKEQKYYEKYHPDLGAMSRDELEILAAQLEVEISEIERSHEGLRKMGDRLKEHSQNTKRSPLAEALPDLLSGLSGSPLVRKELVDKKKLLEAVKVKLKKPAALPPKPPALDPDEEILMAMKKVRERENELLAKESDPEIRKEIQLAARKKLDKLRERL